MPLWGVAFLTCIPNVGAWKKLGGCLTRCHPIVWSLETPCLEDSPCMGTTRKLFNVLNRCEEDVEPDDVTFLFLLSACSHADLAGRIVLFYKISAKLAYYYLHGWSSWLNWAHQHTFSNSTAHFQESAGMWGLSHSHKVHCQDYGANNQSQGCLFLSSLWGWCLFLQRIIGDASSLS